MDVTHKRTVPVGRPVPLMMNKLQPLGVSSG